MVNDTHCFAENRPMAADEFSCICNKSLIWNSNTFVVGNSAIAGLSAVVITTDNAYIYIKDNKK